MTTTMVAINYLEKVKICSISFVLKGKYMSNTFLEQKSHLFEMPHLS
jgi:hypothetical protein